MKIPAGVINLRAAKIDDRTDGELRIQPKAGGWVTFNSAQVGMIAPPINGQDAATKDYVDLRVPKITVSSTAPSSPSVNDVWIDTS